MYLSTSLSVFFPGDSTPKISPSSAGLGGYVHIVMLMKSCRPPVGGQVLLLNLESYYIWILVASFEIIDRNPEAVALGVFCRHGAKTYKALGLDDCQRISCPPHSFETSLQISSCLRRSCGRPSLSMAIRARGNGQWSILNNPLSSIERTVASCRAKCGIATFTSDLLSGERF